MFESMVNVVNNNAVNNNEIVNNNPINRSSLITLKTEPPVGYDDLSYEVPQNSGGGTIISETDVPHAIKTEDSVDQLVQFPVKLEPQESEESMRPFTLNMRWEVKEEENMNEADDLVATKNCDDCYNEKRLSESFDDDRSDSMFIPDFMDSEYIDDPDYDDLVVTTVDLSLVKQENIGLHENDEENNITCGEGVLSSSQPCRIIELEGLKLETYGDYSKCPKCEKNIKSTYILKHIQLHEAPIFKCPFSDCKLSTARKTNLNRHLKVVHNEDNPYFCDNESCTEKFEDPRHLREHVKIVHRRGVKNDLKEVNRKYKCEFPGCEKDYGKRQYLKDHFRKHTGEKKYACEVCEKRFYFHYDMKRHLYRHTGIKPHLCRWKCGAIFASYGGRMRHERTQHGENPYKLNCDICGRPFRFAAEVNKHKLTHLAPHERKVYRCSYCNILFGAISEKDRHEERHQDNDAFQCEECNKVFKNERQLQHHVQHQHHAQNQHQQPGQKKTKEPAKHRCHLCDTPVLYGISTLRRHLARKHSTNYKCSKDGCGKTFEKEHQFQAHVQFHLRRSCHICEKQFKRKQNADIHLMGVHGLTKEDLTGLGR